MDAKVTVEEMVRGIDLELTALAYVKIEAGVPPAVVESARWRADRLIAARDYILAAESQLAELTEAGDKTLRAWAEAADDRDAKQEHIEALKRKFAERDAQLAHLERKFPCGHRYYDWASPEESCVACAAKESVLRTLRQEILEAIPINWTDSILTGPNASFNEKLPATTNVESVLRAVRRRLTELLAVKEGE